MNFKPLSKNSIGVVSALLLVVLLSQSKFFDFLFETALGRSILILFILIIAYSNKILGVVAVLFIIIMFNNSNLGLMEGFTNSSTTDMSGNIDISGNSITGQKGNTLTFNNNSATITDASGQSATLGSGQIANQIKAKASTAKEGFDLIGTENYIKRGKQSNTIPVNTHMKDSNNISPFEGSFSDNFSKF
jgi:hypothetical protein